MILMSSQHHLWHKIMKLTIHSQGVLKKKKEKTINFIYSINVIKVSISLTM